MSKILNRLLELRWDNSIEYLEDDGIHAKEFQQLKLKCEQSLKLQELVKKRLQETKHIDYEQVMLLQELMDESEKYHSMEKTN